MELSQFGISKDPNTPFLCLLTTPEKTTPKPVDYGN